MFPSLTVRAVGAAGHAPACSPQPEKSSGTPVSPLEGPGTGWGVRGVTGGARVPVPLMPSALQVVKVRPNDKDAKLKYQECNKIVKQKAFERAIASDEQKRSVVDSLDIESMSEALPVSPPPPEVEVAAFFWGARAEGGAVPGALRVSGESLGSSLRLWGAWGRSGFSSGGLDVCEGLVGAARAPAEGSGSPQGMWGAVKGPGKGLGSPLGVLESLREAPF